MSCGQQIKQSSVTQWCSQKQHTDSEISLEMKTCLESGKSKMLTVKCFKLIPPALRLAVQEENSFLECLRSFLPLHSFLGFQYSFDLHMLTLLQIIPKDYF